MLSVSIVLTMYAVLSVCVELPMYAVSSKSVVLSVYCFLCVLHCQCVFLLVYVGLSMCVVLSM